MIKKILFSMALVAGLASCNGDYDDWKSPQHNDGSDPIDAISFVVTPQVSEIDFATETATSIQLFTTNVDADSYTVTISGDGTDNTATVTADADGNVATEDLMSAVADVFGGGEPSYTVKATVSSKLNITTDDGDAVISLVASTFTFTAKLPAGAIFDTDPILYLTGSNPDYNWGTNKWVPLVPVCNQWSADADLTAKMEVMSWIIIYLSEGEEFKFAPQAGWGNDFGMEAEIVDIDVTGDANTHVYDPQSGGNLKMTKAGWYLLKVTNTAGAPKVEFLKPNVYLIGDTSPAGWNIADSGLFTAPETANGKFVSPAFIADNKVRMCVNLNEGIDWWRAEFVVLNGQIDYRGNGGDQGAVTVTAGKQCYLDFAKGSGVYK